MVKEIFVSHLALNAVLPLSRNGIFFSLYHLDCLPEPTPCASIFFFLSISFFAFPFSSDLTAMLLIPIVDSSCSYLCNERYIMIHKIHSHVTP